MSKLFLTTWFVALALTFGCKFNKLMKSENIQVKLKAGIEYYKKKDYYKASALLDEIVPLLKGREEAEDAQYYQAFTYYDDKQYVLSAFYFKDFTETYPRSAHVEECAFLQAKSLYKDSPRYDLDQTNTFSAIKAFQAFANKYPKSEYLEEANKLTDELNKKIEIKEYENAKLFLKISNYKSALVALSNFLEKYPAGEYTEEIFFLKVTAQYSLAKASVEGKKKKDRYLETIEFYYDFIDKYPKSDYLKPAEFIFEESTRQVAKILG